MCAFFPRSVSVEYHRTVLLEITLGVNFGDYLSSVVVNKLATEADCFLDEARSTPTRIFQSQMDRNRVLTRETGPI